MASHNEQLLKATQQTRADLLAALAPKDLIYNDLNNYVMRYRISCESLILNDFEFAYNHEIEQKLWDAHVKINKRYQKMLSLTRTCEGKQTPVEYRKTAKRYLDFIKAGQRFYRIYIQRLASKFGGIPELDAVAYNLRLDTSSEEAIVKPSQIVGQAVLASCHQTLVRLGDLSRYREIELGGKEGNWGPAIGYYDLAGAVYPSSGVTHNQLAVIARHREQHLSAIYHLYRAMAAEEPHPLSKGNLELEFKKIEEAWAQSESSTPRDNESPQGSGRSMEKWFMRLHAHCYKGLDFAEQDELENEVLGQMAVDLKERSLESFLNKIVLINITAQYHASEEFQDPPNPPEKMQALLFFLRLNVRTFFTLLQLLQSELGLAAVEDADPQNGDTSMSVPGKITAVARRILPVLRQYSSWLTINLPLLVHKVGDNVLEVQVKEMWRTYANTLTIMASTFDVAALPSIDYLLEEDEDTIHFKPFKDDSSTRYRLQGRIDPKPVFHAPDVERQHPNMEMLARVRDFLLVGMNLAMENEDVPVDFQIESGTFVYREEGVPSELLASPAGRKATLTSTSIKREDIPSTNGSNHVDGVSRVDGNLSHAPSIGTSAELWVNDLVDGEPTDFCATNGLTVHKTVNGSLDPEPSRPSPSGVIGNETSYSTVGSLTAADLVKQVRSSSTPQASPRPRLPSIYNSPFAPQADEEAPLSRPSTAKYITPHHSQQNSQQISVGSLPLSNGQQEHNTLPQGSNEYCHQVNSSMSSVGYPSSIGFSQSMPPKRLTTHSPRNYQINYEDSSFMSSNIFHGSPWNDGFREQGMMQTPPNGQGSGHFG